MTVGLVAIQMVQGLLLGWDLVVDYMVQVEMVEKVENITVMVQAEMMEVVH